MSMTSTRPAPNPWWVALVAGLASYLDACAIVSSGAALAIYQQALGFTDLQVGMASGTLTICIAFGALFGGGLGDRFGRKSVFSVTMIIIIVGVAFQVFAPDFTLLLIGMGLVGLGTGADLPVSLATIAEAGTDENRGKLIGFSNILWIVGILGAVVCQSFVGNMGQIGAQILFAQVGIVALITLILRLPIPESDIWLKSNEERKSGQQTARTENASLRVLLTPKYAKPFIGLTVFYALVNVPANTGGQFTTWINLNIIGLDPAFTAQVSLIMMPIGFIWMAWFMRIVDTKHRMLYFYIGAALYAGSYLIYVVFGFHLWTWIAVSIVNGIGGAFAFEGIMKVWTQESFPTLIRTTAQGTIIFVARLVAAGAAAFTPILVRMSPQGAYLTLFGIAAVGYAFAIWAFHGKQHSEFEVEQVDS